MAYYSGTAASLTALRTALLTHAVADGWTLTGDVLSKAGVFFRIQETATHITCLGCESNAVANPAPSVARIGLIYSNATYGGRLISFPCNYEVFGFAQELYLVVNYDTDKYQWMAFGKTSVPGVPGQGGWCGASNGASTASVANIGLPVVQYISTSTGGSTTWNGNCSALFWTTESNFSSARNCWINHGLDSHGWTWNGADTSDPIGILHTSPLISLQPSAWNSEAALLPIRAWKERPSFKASLIADLENARHVRIDNIAPGDILVIGSDEWKVFPWYIKDAANRNGANPTPTSYDNSGTFGWAIRYEGP